MSSTYGNKDTVNYTYDSRDRVIATEYKNSSDVQQARYTFTYDWQNRLARVANSSEGYTTYYTYDLSDRTLRGTQMKQTNITINGYSQPNGAYRIVINNLGLNKKVLKKVYLIIEHFTNGTELFFGHYKKDGIYLSGKEMKQLNVEITNFFRSFGEYHQIKQQSKRWGKIINYSDLTVCRGPRNDSTFKILDKIFNYYLETIIFSPNIAWDTFVSSYVNYMKRVTDDYVLNGYTDFLFTYFDSGDFSISFDPKKFNTAEIEEKIEDLLYRCNLSEDDSVIDN